MAEPETHGGETHEEHHGAPVDGGADAGKAGKKGGLWKTHKVDIIAAVVGIMVTVYLYMKSKSSASTTAASTTPTASDGTVGSGSGDSGGGGGGWGGGQQQQAAAAAPTTPGSTTINEAPPASITIPGTNITIVEPSPTTSVLSPQAVTTKTAAQPATPVNVTPANVTVPEATAINKTLPASRGGGTKVTTKTEAKGVAVAAKTPQLKE